MIYKIDRCAVCGASFLEVEFIQNREDGYCSIKCQKAAVCIVPDYCLLESGYFAILHEGAFDRVS